MIDVYKMTYSIKAPLAFHRGAGASTVDLSVFSCVQFDKREFVNVIYQGKMK